MPSTISIENYSPRKSPLKREFITEIQVVQNKRQQGNKVSRKIQHIKQDMEQLKQEIDPMIKKFGELEEKLFLLEQENAIRLENPRIFKWDFPISSTSNYFLFYFYLSYHLIVIIDNEPFINITGWPEDKFNNFYQSFEKWFFDTNKKWKNGGKNSLKKVVFMAFSYFNFFFYFY